VAARSDTGAGDDFLEAFEHGLLATFAFGNSLGGLRFRSEIMRLEPGF
jgi:hypothetical protein